MNDFFLGVLIGEAIVAVLVAIACMGTWLAQVHRP